MNQQTIQPGTNGTASATLHVEIDLRQVARALTLAAKLKKRLMPNAEPLNYLSVVLPAKPNGLVLISLGEPTSQIES
jgi:hypothetical protein